MLLSQPGAPGNPETLFLQVARSPEGELLRVVTALPHNTFILPVKSQWILARTLCSSQTAHSPSVDTSGAFSPWLLLFAHAVSPILLPTPSSLLARSAQILTSTQIPLDRLTWTCPFPPLSLSPLPGPSLTAWQWPLKSLTVSLSSHPCTSYILSLAGGC